MKRQSYDSVAQSVFAALLIIRSVTTSLAQVTAVPSQMNFQGRLTRPDGTPVANGNYTITFRLFSVATGGTALWSHTLSVTARNGTFNALLGGSSGTLSGPLSASLFSADRFLEMQIGSNTPLSPRQPLASVAYAMKAGSVSDGSITGASIANGTITSADLATGTLNNVAWLLNGNSGVTTGFLGTTDSNPLELRVNNRRAMRYQYAQNTSGSNSDFHYRSINVLGGSQINEIGVGVVGATVAGGGQDYFNTTDSPNRVLADFGAVGGGRSNTASGNASIVAGGVGNTASGSVAIVGGGNTNTASGSLAMVAGGAFNTAAGELSFAAGYSAVANHNGTFVWNGNTGALISTGAQQFLIGAAGGVGINVNNPGGAKLRVQNGVTGVGVFVGNLSPFGEALFQTNLSTPGTHIWCAENGGRVFSVTAGGLVNAASYQNLSDRRYKTNIATFDNALDTILNLRGVTFDWDREQWKGRGFARGRQIGFIAQEVETALPELVSTDEKGYKSVAYANVVPVLVEALKSLKAQKDSEVNALKQEMAVVQRENARKETRIAELEARMVALLERLERLEASHK